jgi:metal-responsive CopG/Arc/MetJ family transcriptional regulator
MWMNIHMKAQGTMLKTIQITLPQELLAKIDQAVTELDTNRSAFARRALEDALFRARIEQMERQDAEGFARHPQDADETALWESIQDWGDPYEAR